MLSSPLRTKEGRRWSQQLESFEFLVNAIVYLIAPRQYKAGKEALEALLDEDRNLLPPHHRQIAQTWHSIFTGISVIANRETPPHRDRGSSFHDYDLLCSAGTHERARLLIRDFNHSFSYQPGVVVALCGRLLQHQVRKLGTSVKGERVCYAHFMKQKVLARLGTSARAWVTLQDFGF